MRNIGWSQARRKAGSRNFIKSLGLDINRVDRQELKNIATLLEERIRRSLEEVLGRREEYDVLISVSVDSGCINVSMDLGLSSSKPLTPELEFLLDQAVDNALETLEYELLSKYGKT